MRNIAAWIINALSSPVGLVVFAALDSTLFFSLPFGIDGAVIIAAAHGGSITWAIPFLATVGSTGGAALTFWMGAKVGEHSLERHVSAARLNRARRLVKKGGAAAIALLDLIPPPFPFSPFVLAAGALKVHAPTLFGILVVCRIARFGLEVYLANRFGRTVLSWIESNTFRDVVFVFIALAVAASIFSVVKLVRSSREPSRRLAA
jgi:membrane protein YqaA with SNARE-associated domain